MKLDQRSLEMKRALDAMVIGKSLQKWKKLQAIERIKAQPFFGKINIGGVSSVYWNSMSAARYAATGISFVGMDLAAHDGDRTAVWAEKHGMIDAKSRRADAFLELVAMGKPRSTRE